MIVDDHAAFRQVLRTLLEAADAECVECRDGLEATARYAAVNPDLVLMDIQMPGLDGLGATAQLKRRFPAARVYMLSQYDDADLREAARQAGAAGYLRKDDLSPVPALLRPARPCPGPTNGPGYERW